VAERIDDAAYLDRLGQLRADLATHEATPRDGVPAKRAVEWLRVLAETWVTAEVPAAYANGLALVLPQVVMGDPPHGARVRDHSTRAARHRGARAIRTG
jgi:hypothetical protein